MNNKSRSVINNLKSEFKFHGIELVEEDIGIKDYNFIKVVDIKTNIMRVFHFVYSDFYDDKDNIDITNYVKFIKKQLDLKYVK